MYDTRTIEMRGWNMFALRRLVLLTLFVACNSRPDVQGKVNATIDGQVFVTGPVEGALVSAYVLDLASGQEGELLATSAKTSANGTYHLDLGSYKGPILLVARGVGATYVEPASGVTVAWDSSTELRAPFVEWKGPALNFQLALAQATQITISPWSELAVTYASSRSVHQKSPSYAAALDAAVKAFRDHLEVDYWSVPPTDLTSGAAAWNEPVKLAVAYTAVSKLVLRMAQESQISPSGLTTLQLLASLRTDLEDAQAQFDGRQDALDLEVGTCPSICRLKADTLRANLSESAAEFLGSSANRSGITVTDAQTYLARISARVGDLWPTGGGPGFDTTPPVITVEGLQGAGILSAQVSATIWVTDAIAMGDDEADILVRFQRAGNPVTGFFDVARASPDAQTRVLSLTLHTLDVSDGPIELTVQAKDKAGNQATPLDLSLFIDNSPLGAITGTVVVSGRVAGARVRAYEYDGGTKKKMLGETLTDDEGVYRLEVTDTVSNSILLEADNAGTGPAAQFIEATSGDVVIFSADDTLSSILTGWANGAKRSDGMLTPWTSAATAFASGLWKSPLYNSVPAQWVAAVEDAYGLLEQHFTADGNRIQLRAVQPADLTQAGVTTLNAQARYGLLDSGLSELARKHAMDSFATSATVNTLTLTKLLSADLGQDGDGVKPLWDGKTMVGRITHGRVDLTSYVTRVDLATYAVQFLNNPRNMTRFTMLDVDKLLDAISADANPRLYPDTEPPLPYDTIKPIVSITAGKPAEGLVTRGQVALEATATDNRALSTFAWEATPTLPVETISNVLLDRGSQIAGPWVLSGTLDTDALAEGSAILQARATDESRNSATAARTIIVDRTPPVVTITSATKADASPLAAGGWTAPTTLTVAGTVNDANLQSASYTVNGAGGPLSLGGGGVFTVHIPMATTGTYTLVVTGVDKAGNSASQQAAWNCDASPPTITVVPSQFKDDTGRTVSVDGPGTGIATYGQDVTTVTLSSGAIPAFQKFQTRYNSQNSSLPVWAFNVADNYWPETNIVLEAKLTRGSTLLVDWFTVAGAGSGFNRSVKVSDALHPDVANFSGRYTLTLRARDGFGNQSREMTVQWDQTIRTPPLRQRVEVIPCSCSDPKCVAHYSLGAQSGICSAYSYQAAGLLWSQVRAAAAYVDNPNPVPIQFILIGDLTASAGHGMEWKNPELSNPVGVVKKCEDTGLLDATPQGACYSKHAGGEFGTADVLSPTGLLAGYEVSGATYLGLNASGWPAYEIAPSSSATVFMLSKPWTFLLPHTPADYSSYGTLTNVVGWQETRFYSCDQTRLVNGEPMCVSQSERGALLLWTRGHVNPNARVSVYNRVSNGTSLDDATTWTQRVGTNLDTATYNAFNFFSLAPGYL